MSAVASSKLQGASGNFQISPLPPAKFSLLSNRLGWVDIERINPQLMYSVPLVHHHFNWESIEVYRMRKRTVLIGVLNCDCHQMINRCDRSK